MPNSPQLRSPQSARPLAFGVLKDIYQGGYADVVLHRHLERSPLTGQDRALATELVYGIVRRQRTLDALVDQLGTKKSHQQPLELRIGLHLGLYQLRYLDQIPPSAAVNTSVELVKGAGLSRLAGVTNGILRQYIRLRDQGSAPPAAVSPPAKIKGVDTQGSSVRQGSPDIATFLYQQQDGQWDPLQLPADEITALGLYHSFPDWIVALWWEGLGRDGTHALCDWLNRPPSLDLRVHTLKATVPTVQTALADREIATHPLAAVPGALRLDTPPGDLRALPGYDQGWWAVQDASAQLVSYFVDPQPGQVVIDACAAPGGKAAHLAALMGDKGQIWACDRTPSRLKKVQQTCDRLGLQSITPMLADSTTLTRFTNQGDRVLVDAPCSGLGTLHRHADARWRQTPATVAELAQLQQRLLAQAATWVKAGGTLVYATCTLHPAENEAQVDQFLATHSNWCLLPPEQDSPLAPYGTPEGWVKIWPHYQDMDGFFMARFARP